MHLSSHQNGVCVDNCLVKCLSRHQNGVCVDNCLVKCLSSHQNGVCVDGMAVTKAIWDCRRGQGDSPHGSSAPAVHRLLRVLNGSQPTASAHFASSLASGTHQTPLPRIGKSPCLLLQSHFYTTISHQPVAIITITLTPVLTCRLLHSHLAYRGAKWLDLHLGASF